MSKDNGRKSRRGANGKRALRKMVEELESCGALKSSVSSPFYGYEGYFDSQFKAHEEIRYHDDSKAVLYATSSLRSDRLQEDQWRAFNIKAIDPDVDYAYVILPDETGFDQGTAPRDQIREGRVISAIDDVVTMQEFYDRTMADYSETLKRGAGNDLQGRKLENLFVSILTDEGNLRRYNGSREDTGFVFNIYELVMSKLGIRPGDLLFVDASNDIPALPSGGKPKTDVAAVVRLRNGVEEKATFSLKNSSQRYVSVHEYSASQFSEVLDPENDELRRLLEAFQSVGNKRDMNPEEIDSLTSELKPYLGKLERWVFAGEGVEGAEPIQIAQYIVVRDKGTGRFFIYGIDEYIQKLRATHESSDWFGTVFSWTYPSKKRGKKIQLKARLSH